MVTVYVSSTLQRKPVLAANSSGVKCGLRPQRRNQEEPRKTPGRKSVRQNFRIDTGNCPHTYASVEQAHRDPCDSSRVHAGST